ncbi:MAG: hypothetical protein ACLTER_18055 [Ruminococcus sp.]
MQSFFLQYIDYFAAKGIVSMNYEFTRNSLPVIPEHEQIFKYDFKNGVLVDEKKYKKAKIYCCHIYRRIPCYGKNMVNYVQDWQLIHYVI